MFLGRAINAKFLFSFLSWQKQIMNPATSFLVLPLLVLVGFSTFIVTKKYLNNHEGIPPIVEDKNSGEHIKRTHTIIKDFYPFPKDLNETRKLLEHTLGAKHIEFGFLIQPYVFAKGFGLFGKWYTQFSNILFLAEDMSVSTVHVFQEISVGPKRMWPQARDQDCS